MDTLERLGRRPVEDDGPRLVARIAVDARPEVEDDGVAGMDFAVPVAVVRLRAVGSRRDDRLEGDAVPAVAVAFRLDAPRTFAPG